MIHAADRAGQNHIGIHQAVTRIDDSNCVIINDDCIPCTEGGEPENLKDKSAGDHGEPLQRSSRAASTRNGKGTMKIKKTIDGQAQRRAPIPPTSDANPATETSIETASNQER